MRKIFIDTNILIDFLSAREPFNEFALKIFKDALDKKIILFISSHTLLTSHYLLKKNISEGDLREILLNILNHLSVIPVDEAILRKSLNSNFKDFEDAVQINCAYKIENIDRIITRNKKDFKGCEIPVISPDEY